MLAIKENVGGIAPKIKSKAELKEYLEAIGIVYIDYIADLAIYRFTEEEKIKAENKLVELLILMEEYQELIDSEDKRKLQYIKELQEIQTNNKKGKYSIDK